MCCDFFNFSFSLSFAFFFAGLWTFGKVIRRYSDLDPNSALVGPVRPTNPKRSGLEAREEVENTVYPVFQVQLIFSFQFQVKHHIYRSQQRQSTKRQYRDGSDDRARQTMTVQRRMCFHTKLNVHNSKPSLSHEQRRSQLQTQEGNMRNYQFFHRGFINAESCVQAATPSLDDTSLKTTTPP